MKKKLDDILFQFLTTGDLSKRWGLGTEHLANMRWQGLGPPYLKKGGIVLYPLLGVRRHEKEKGIEPIGAKPKRARRRAIH